VGAIAIETEEWLAVINKVLRQDARHDRLANTAFLATDKMNCAHA
jgi:hypothetical protein